jgi:SAM-dependent methyltransferase
VAAPPAFPELVRCPDCERARLRAAEPDAVRCPVCDARFPVTDGVLDLLPRSSGRRSPAQALMESRAIASVYESRLWRRNPLAALLLRLSFERELALVAGAAELARARSVLDLACGTGIYARPLARRLPGGGVIGLDLSLPMLRHAHRRARAEGLSNLWLVRGDARELPFEDARFDVVNCCGALHLFPDLDAVLREIARVLAPGGRFTTAAFRRREGERARARAALRRRLAGVDAFVPAELAARLEDAGLSDPHCHHAAGPWLVMSARRA